MFSSGDIVHLSRAATSSYNGFRNLFILAFFNNVKRWIVFVGGSTTVILSAHARMTRDGEDVSGQNSPLMEEN